MWGALLIRLRSCLVALPSENNLAQSQIGNRFRRVRKGFARKAELSKRMHLFNNHRKTPMKFRPLHDRVVVRRIDAEAKTVGGIIIPDTAQEKPQQGEVVAVGAGGRDDSGKLIPIEVKAGDRVLFGKWSGSEVKIDNVEYLIMKESDVMGVLVDAAVRVKAA